MDDHKMDQSSEIDIQWVLVSSHIEEQLAVETSLWTLGSKVKQLSELRQEGCYCTRSQVQGWPSEIHMQFGVESLRTVRPRVANEAALGFWDLCVKVLGWILISVFGS